MKLDTWSNALPHSLLYQRFYALVSARGVLAEANDGKMAQGWHGQTVDEEHAVARGVEPLLEALPGEFRTPAELLHDGLDHVLDRQAGTLVGADAVQKDDFAAGLQYAGELLQRD